MLKEQDNPPIIYPTEEALAEFSGQWWVAHTKSRNEKALAHDLLAREVRYFLPMSWTISRKSRRPVRSLLPLFTGYLFFCGREEDRVEALRTNRVAGIIEVPDQIRLVEEMTRIEKALRLGAPLSPHPYLKKGQWCRVVAGPLMGLEGIVEEIRDTMRLILQINMLGQAASVEIAMDMIEPIDAPSSGEKK